MKERYHPDYFPGYDIEEIENQPLVKNPKLLGAKKAKKKLQVELAKLRKMLVTSETLIWCGIRGIITKHYQHHCNILSR